MRIRDGKGNGNSSVNSGFLRPDIVTVCRYGNRQHDDKLNQGNGPTAGTAGKNVVEPGST